MDHSAIAYVFMHNNEIGNIYEPRYDPVYLLEENEKEKSNLFINKDSVVTSDSLSVNEKINTKKLKKNYKIY